MTGQDSSALGSMIADGKYTLFWISGQTKQVHSEVFASLDLAQRAFNNKMNCSRTLVDGNFDIKNSKSRSKNGAFYGT